jgi:alpha-L-arabinofuranosidase
MQMYSRLLGDEHVESSSSSATLDCGDGVHVPVVDAVVTRRGGRLVVALVNRHPDTSTDCRISLDGRPLGPVEVERTTLVGDGTDAYNSPTEPDRVLPVQTTERIEGGVVRLPAHSVSVLVVPQEIAPATADWVRAGGEGWRQTTAGGARTGPRVDWAF